MRRRLLRTQGVRAVARALLDEPEVLHWGAELCDKTGVGTGAIQPILRRFTDAGLLVDAGMAPSDVGGSPRHVYRVVDVAGLKELL